MRFSPVSLPEFVAEGYQDERLAARRFDNGKYFVVAYKETEADGFVITAFFTSRILDC